MPAAALAALDQLPHVWRGRALATPVERTVPTGHAALDAELPAGGWPLGCLIEVLQARATQHVWQLLAPGLAQAARLQPGPVVLVHPPCLPFTPGLRGQGLAHEPLLCVQAEPPAARLWAAEQALRCGDVGAVLAWLPRARAEDLRRLHLGAQQHGRLLVVFRGLEAATQASPARLRLVVQGADRLEVRILKRRGPPLLQPLVLGAQPARLAALLAARRRGRMGAPAVATASATGAMVSGAAIATASSSITRQGAPHALDRPLALVR